MAAGTVKSTQEAIDAIQRMKTAIDTGLVDAITQFKTDGDSLNPENFDGGRAAAFYSEWPNVTAALDKAIDMVNGITEEVRNANSDIQMAGGNQ